jgi:hypothetical protein
LRSRFPAVGSAMADVFVSYAKTDRSLASKLVVMLEAEGWKVWWDTSLAAADLYRDEIMKQLALARAVITIWTPNSIRSDWVRAEAGTAKKEGKLIPVKTSDVAYADIPLPFGEMHTENLESSELIRAAVVAQLAKPEVEPSAVALLTRGFKWELLTWVGIVGGALTLFTNLGSVLKLADWARLLVQRWKDWTHAFWLWAFGWLGIHLPPEWTPVLTFLSFGLFLTIGQAFKFNRIIRNQPIVDKYQGKSFQLISWRTLFCLLSMLVALAVPTLISGLFVRPGLLTLYLGRLTVLIGPPVIMVLFARHRLYAALSAFLLEIFFVIIALRQLIGSEVPAAGLTALAMAMVLPLILLAVAPAKAVTRRLIFLALGLILLIALNELSKLGLDVTAPKLHG